MEKTKKERFEKYRAHHDIYNEKGEYMFTVRGSIGASTALAGNKGWTAKRS